MSGDDRLPLAQADALAACAACGARQPPDYAGRVLLCRVCGYAPEPVALWCCLACGRRFIALAAPEPRCPACERVAV